MTNVGVVSMPSATASRKSLSTISPNTLGVRIPKHEFTLVLQQAKVPFITTSANIHGEKAPSSTKEIFSESLFVPK